MQLLRQGAGDAPRLAQRDPLDPVGPALLPEEPTGTAGGMYVPPGEDPGGMDGGGKSMRIMKTGEPCPCCGQAIPAMLPVDKQLLASIVAEGLAIQDAVRTVEHGVVEGQEAMPTLTPPNEPLTLEQLREMSYTDWVWVVFPELPPEENGWIRASQIYRRYSHEHYGKTWIAYRRSPEGEVNA